jgi:GDP-mannose pyrophosphatase NudK
MSLYPHVSIKNTEILADDWFPLKKVTFKYSLSANHIESQTRECYFRGNGATVLMYNKEKRTVILTRQFRLPAYLNGHKSGFLIESCAGLLEEEAPETCVIREAEEETGYRIENVKKVFELYMTPGAVTELMHFFVAEYRDDMKVDSGGGLADEQENIEVLEIDFDQCRKMMATGEIQDAKTIILLQFLIIQKLL